MPNPWMPDLIQDPGAAATYPAGRNAMQFVVHHDTGGTNSYQICKDGRPGYGNSLCNILIPKTGTPWQFGPIDAVTYHCGSTADYDHDGDQDDYNPVGPGIEVERLQGDELTASQALWLAKIGLWLETEWGIPNVQYRGAPLTDADNFHGHVNHRDLHPNPDGLSPAEWDAIVALNTPPNPNLEDDMASIDFFATDPTDRRNVWWFGAAGRRHVSYDEWVIIQTDRAFKGLDPVKPFAGTPTMFSSTPVVGQAPGSGPTTVTSTVTSVLS